MPRITDSPERFFRTLGVLYVGMFWGNVLFFFIAYYWVRLEGGGLNLPTQYRRITVLTAALAVGVIVMLATLIYQRTKATGAREKNLMRKRQRYQVGSILYASMLNGAALFLLVVFMMDGSNWYLGLYAAVLGLYLLRRPSKSGFVRDMGLSREQLHQLEEL